MIYIGMGVIGLFRRVGGIFCLVEFYALHFDQIHFSLYIYKSKKLSPKKSPNKSLHVIDFHFLGGFLVALDGLYFLKEHKKYILLLT